MNKEEQDPAIEDDKLVDSFSRNDDYNPSGAELQADELKTGADRIRARKG